MKQYKDSDMAKELTDKGYDVEYESDSNYNEGLVAEMAINEGYRWDDETEKWEGN